MSAVSGPSSTTKTEEGHGEHIVNLANNLYQLDEKKLEDILLRPDVKDLPVVVVSVAGSFRGGKSFLLNFFLRYLSAPEEARNENGDWLGGETEPLKGFSWRGGSQRHTTGINMWSEPFIANLPSGEKVAVLLMDTQGTFDSSSTVRDCSTIFALSTLVSSVIIYNIKENIKEDDLQNLQLFTEYGKLSKNEDGKKPFQVLEFLVRDWQYDYEHAYGHKGGEELLAIRMEETPSMPPELRDLRQQIRSCFEKLTCFLMPYPGRAVTKRNFSGSLSELDEDFKDALKELVPSIFAPANLTPKLINGQPVKARDLFTYFKTYMAIFNSDEMPSPVSIAKATEKAALLSAVDEARELYETRMENVTSPEEPSLTALALDDEHRKALAAARTAFIDKKKMAAKKESDAYLAQMTHELDDRLPLYVSMNDAKLRKTISEARESYEKTIRQVRGKNLLCLHPLDLEGVHDEAVQAALAYFDIKRKSIPNMPDMERIKFVESFKNDLENLKNDNEQHNRMTVAAVRSKFSADMEALLSKNPPLDDDEFEAKYNEVKQDCINAFNSKRNRPTKHVEDSFKDSLLQAMATQFVSLQTINRSHNRKQFQRALDFYTNYMTMFWNPDTCCLHPDDLLQAHKTAKEQAVRMFKPTEASEDEDFEKTLLTQMLELKYFQAKDQNDALNTIAVDTAYKKYLAIMGEKCQASWWWLLIIPIIIDAASVPRYHRESKEAALIEFYSKRRDTMNPATDRFLDQLNEKIDAAYARF